MNKKRSIEKKRRQEKKNQNNKCFPKIFFRLKVHIKCLSTINKWIDCRNKEKYSRNRMSSKIGFVPRIRTRLTFLKTQTQHTYDNVYELRKACF